MSIRKRGETGAVSGEKKAASFELVQVLIKKVQVLNDDGASGCNYAGLPLPGAQIRALRSE